MSKTPNSSPTHKSVIRVIEESKRKDVEKRPLKKGRLQPRKLEFEENMNKKRPYEEEDDATATESSSDDEHNRVIRDIGDFFDLARPIQNGIREENGGKYYLYDCPFCSSYNPLATMMALEDFQTHVRFCLNEYVLEERNRNAKLNGVIVLPDTHDLPKPKEEGFFFVVDEEDEDTE